jgi:hypothetical protein
MADPKKPEEKEPPKPATPAPEDSAYTEDEEAEVQKRLEDLGYVE